MKNLVNGRFMDSSNNKVIDVINPADNEKIDDVPDTTVQDVEECVRLAKNAQKKWNNIPLHKRGEILYKFSDLVEENKEELAMLLSRETGKPIKEARAEISNVKMFVAAYVERAKHLYGIVIPQGNEPGQENTIQYTIRQPLGVVATIIPFNFPSDLFCQKVPSALIMGNSVIVKPSTSNPLTLGRFCQLMKEAGVVDGAINCLFGRGEVVGDALSKSNLVDLVSLTGSTQVGIDTMRNCATNLTHTTLELGGNDAFIVTRNADLDLAADEIVWGRLYNTGQVCCASKRFLVDRAVVNEFTSKVIDRISKLRVSNPQDEKADIGCLISESAAKKVESQVRQTIMQGAKIVYGGRRAGAFFEPTVLVDVNKDCDVMIDMEIFGPVIPICAFDSLDEAVEIANKSKFGLCGAVFSCDIKEAMDVASRLECGGAVINGASFYRSAEMPFGGWKYSGIGNEGISTTLQEMSHIKTIVLKNVLK